MKNQLALGLAFVLSLAACKSVYEKQGDKHLAEGDGWKAIQRYQLAQKKGVGSKNFDRKLAQAYILGLKQTSNTVGEPDAILTYRERIIELMAKLGDESLERQYIETIYRAAEQLVKVEDPRFRNVCRYFIADVGKYGASEHIQNRMARISIELEEREQAAHSKEAITIYTDN